MGCQGCLQCTLKLLNFMVTLVGAYMVLYGLWMLKEWHSQLPPEPPAPALPPSPTPVPSPSPSPSPILPPVLPPVPVPSSEPTSAPSSVPDPLFDGLGLPIFFNGRDSDNFEFGAAGLGGDLVVAMEQRRRPFLVMSTGVSRRVIGLPKLPVPWFIYAFLGAGIITCLVTCTGHIAAETSHGFCLSCYTCLQVVLLIAQFALAGYLFFDHHWREDIPDDPTGELDKVEAFVEDNLNICKWVALAVVGMEILGLFFAMILRAVSSNARRTGYDSDDDYLAPRSNGRQPLLNRQVNQSNPPTAPGSTADNRPVRNDAWSTRLREKYGLDTSEFPQNPSESRRSVQQNSAPPTEEKQSRCTIM
ncbi:hypothetical protein CY35_15G093800 [Sphagnum magellanicum]|nr:hypothetical protein CY35_15G093800 [Sphagnum magellanicum]